VYYASRKRSRGVLPDFPVYFRCLTPNELRALLDATSDHPTVAHVVGELVYLRRRATELERARGADALVPKRLGAFTRLRAEDGCGGDDVAGHPGGVARLGCVRVAVHRQDSRDCRA
jgi:hypothetical protein